MSDSPEIMVKYYAEQERKKILNMEPGPSMDYEVWKTVMKRQGELRPFSTNIYAAWEVFELNGTMGIVAYQGVEYACTLWAKWDEDGNGVHVQAKGGAAPEAICKAALLAVMGL